MSSLRYAQSRNVNPEAASDAQNVSVIFIILYVLEVSTRQFLQDTHFLTAEIFNGSLLTLVHENITNMVEIAFVLT